MKASLFLRLFLLLAAVLAIPVAGTAQAPAYERGPELDANVDYFALIKTNHGDFALRLFADVAPITVRNFVNLAEGTREFRDAQTGERVIGRKYYDGLIFHRVIPNFMIQGGCPRGEGTGDPGYRFRDEFNPAVNFDRPGILAKANSGANTNGSQFFITEVPTPHLNQRHTIFGEVLAGSGGVDLVKKISAVEKGRNDKPVQPVVMQSVVIVRLAKGISDADALPSVLAGESSVAPAPEADEAATTTAEPEAEPVN